MLTTAVKTNRRRRIATDDNGAGGSRFSRLHNARQARWVSSASIPSFAATVRPMDAAETAESLTTFLKEFPSLGPAAIPFPIVSFPTGPVAGWSESAAAVEMLGNDLRQRIDLADRLAVTLVNASDVGRYVPTVATGAPSPDVERVKPYRRVKSS